MFEASTSGEAREAAMIVDPSEDGPERRAGLDASPSTRRLEVFLIKPTKYDDDGYLLRHWRSVLPSNSLACLHALTEEVRSSGVLGRVELRAHLCDESVEALPERRILRTARRDGTQVLVCLVGVQTNHFPRAIELARRFRRRGIGVIIGGFHVSGSLAMLPEVPPELARLMDDGVTLINGEVEETWGRILLDAVHGRLSRRYDTVNDKPDLFRAPVPRLDSRLMKKFVYRHFGTIDSSRGCPFTCSFCTIINVQGRKMRFRDAEHITTAMEHNYRNTGTHHYFFTDDNFARSKNWREIFERMIRLREERGIPVRFLMQVDTLSDKIPGFIEMARRAGCFQVFIGMESLNPESLKDGGKRQNKVADYAKLIAAWREADILTHVGYIIGFAHDTPEIVRENIRTLKEEIRVDLAAFFMLTPLPGSADHLRMTRAGVALDADFNRYDTFHPVVEHPRMSRDTWFELYEQAWEDFYTFEHMKQQLEGRSGELHTSLLQMYLWYKSSVVVERFHPMMTGFFRLKPRVDRRPGQVAESRLRHLRRRLPEIGAAVADYANVLAELERLWIATRKPELTGTRETGAFSALHDWRGFLAAMFLGGNEGGAPPRVRTGAEPPTMHRLPVVSPAEVAD